MEFVIQDVNGPVTNYNFGFNGPKLFINQSRKIQDVV